MSTRMQACITGCRLDVYFQEKLGICLPCQLAMFQAMFGQVLNGNKEEIAATIDNLTAQERSIKLNKISEDMFTSSHARLFLALYNAIPTDKERAKLLVRHVRQMFHPIVKIPLIHASHHIPPHLLVTWKGPFNPNILKQREDNYEYCPFQDEDEHPMPPLPFLYVDFYVWVQREGITTPEVETAVVITDDTIIELIKSQIPVTKELLQAVIYTQKVAVNIIAGQTEASVELTNADLISYLLTARLFVKFLQKRVLALTAKIVDLKKRLSNEQTNQTLASGHLQSRVNVEAETSAMQTPLTTFSGQTANPKGPKPVAQANQTSVEEEAGSSGMQTLTDSRSSFSNQSSKTQVSKPVVQEKQFVVSENESSSEMDAQEMPDLEESSECESRSERYAQEMLALEQSYESMDIDFTEESVEIELFPEKSGHRMEGNRSVTCDFCGTTIKHSQKYIKYLNSRNHTNRHYAYLHYDTRSRKWCALFEAPRSKIAPIMSQRLEEFFNAPQFCKPCLEATGAGFIYSGFHNIK